MVASGRSVTGQYGTKVRGNLRERALMPGSKVFEIVNVHAGLREIARGREMGRSVSTPPASSLRSERSAERRLPRRSASEGGPRVHRQPQPLRAADQARTLRVNYVARGSARPLPEYGLPGLSMGFRLLLKRFEIPSGGAWHEVESLYAAARELEATIASNVTEILEA